MPRITRKKSEVKQEPVDVDPDREDEKCESSATPAVKSEPHSQCLMVAASTIPLFLNKTKIN